MKKIILLLALTLLISASLFSQLAKDENPAALGFNARESDARAMQIADEVMRALGGRQNWDNTRYISWNFFGRRRLVWDKWQGDVRIEADSTVYLVNIAGNTGKVKKGSEVITNPDSLKKYVERGISIWINDSYWLVMPFKLKDSGVTLKYMGEQNTNDGKPADVLQLTFQNVGRTPDNKYLVYVDKSSRLITQWQYFEKYTDDQPQFTNPWSNYQKMGNIMLSDERGRGKHTDVRVYPSLPESVFTSFEKVDYSNLKP
jgi:hypothetical protein